MKVAIVNTYDSEGGAARAAFRLHEALGESGVDSAMFVQQRAGAEEGVHGPYGNLPRLWGRLHWQLDHLPAQFAGAKRGEFSVGWLGGRLRARLEAFKPDVVHLHWVNAGYVSLREIADLQAPTFWTAHDMWPFTGGCHYDRDCGNFETQGCDTCPLQTRLPRLPLAARRLDAKVSTASRAAVEFIGPSRWMAKVAARSPVARGRPVHVVPNAIDLTRYKPVDRRAARDLFGLPQDRVVMLFGGVLSNQDPRKGFHLLDEALAMLSHSDWAGRVSLCVFGSANRQDSTIHGIPTRYVGHLHDNEALIALYSACDLFMAPSLQDNLPNTVMEAAACGVPTVAFDIGGMSDLIEHGVSGWLAAAGDARQLADGVVQAARDDAWRLDCGRAARAHAERHYAYPVVAAAHLALYRARLALAAASK